MEVLVYGIEDIKVYDNLLKEEFDNWKKGTARDRECDESIRQIR